MSATNHARKVRVSNGNVGRASEAIVTADALNNATYCETVSGALAAAYGHLRDATKLIARRHGFNPRTVRNWMERRNGPSGVELVKLMRESDEVFDAVCRLAEREPGKPLSARQRAAAAELLRIIEGANENDLG